MQLVKFLGVVRRSGVGKESKKPYDMFSLSFITQVNPGQMGAMTVDGFGYEAKEMPLDEACYFQMKSDFKDGLFKALSDIGVEVSININNPKQSFISSYQLNDKKTAVSAIDNQITSNKKAS